MLPTFSMTSKTVVSSKTSSIFLVSSCPMLRENGVPSLVYSQVPGMTLPATLDVSMEIVPHPLLSEPALVRLHRLRLPMELPQRVQVMERRRRAPPVDQQQRPPTVAPQQQQAPVMKRQQRVPTVAPQQQQAPVTER